MVRLHRPVRLDYRGFILIHFEMSYCVDTFIPCENVQQPLNGYFTNFDPTMNRDVNTFLRFLTSAENKAGVKVGELVDLGNGRKRVVNLVYMPRFPEHEAGDDPCDTCATGEPIGSLKETYELECVGTHATRKIKLADLETNCRDDEYWYARMVNALIDVVMRRMNSTTISQVAALIGNSFTTSTKNSSGQFVNTAVEDIQYNIRARGEISNDIPVVIVGEDLIMKYFWAEPFGAMSDAQALDWARYIRNYNIAFVQDMKIEDGNPDIGTSGLGANHFLATVPGALQLLTFNKFRGSQWRAGNNLGTTLEKGVIADPIYGIPLDYRVTITCEDGDDHVNVWVGLEHELVGMPTDMFCAGDAQDGQVYTWDVTVSNP
jgi:hypothetical protein